MRICNRCDWTGLERDCVKLGDIGPLCPDCKETTHEGKPHDWDDEAICKKCRLDGAEADYYSKRGYAHEYPTLHDCPGKR